jgi:hypothetical protein
MKDPEYSRPIGDDRLWLKNKLGSDYKGPEPEPHSPPDREAELTALRQVLFGVRFPKTRFEKSWLRYMGGIQNEPPLKWVTCHKCAAQFEAAGFPAPHSGPANYPTICRQCDDETASWASYRWIPQKKKVRSVCND